MTENDWPRITADLISINSMPDGPEKDSQIQKILNLLYPSDIDLNSCEKKDYAKMLSPFMGRILHAFRSFCSKKRKAALSHALELLPCCQYAIYDSLKKYDPNSIKEDDRILDRFLIKKCINAMLQQYSEDHPQHEVALLDKPLNKDDRRTSLMDMTPDIHAASPEEIAAGLQKNEELTDRYFPDELYSCEEQMLMGLIILHIFSDKNLSKWTRNKQEVAPELFKTPEDKKKALIQTLDNIMLSIINGNNRNISEAELINILCQELPTAKQNVDPNHTVQDTYTENYIRCCISRIYRKWEQSKDSVSP